MRKPLFVFAIALFICGVVVASQPGVKEMQSYRSDGAFDRAAFDAEQQRKLAWLVAEQVEQGLATPISIKLSESEVLEIESGRCEGCQESATKALLAGMVKPVAMHFELDGFSHGAMERFPDGGLVWSAAIESTNAAGVRVHFTDFSLPAGFELWLYSMEGNVRGPYTGRGPGGNGDFWSHTIAGERALLQLRGAGPLAARQTVSFKITDLGHIGRGAATKAFCSFNAWCVENGECFANSAVDDPKNAVAHMQYVKRPYIYFCSGGLLASSINPDTPYFLTANHCISRSKEATTLETFFQFTTGCGVDPDSCPDYNQLGAPSTIGSTVLATNTTSDFTLLQLSQAPPAGSVFMGWTTASVVDSGDSLYRISHPGGAPQAYSQHDEWEPPVVCSGWPRGQWIYSQDIVGATEGGSSGSPVVNAGGQVVGQLSGGCGYNVNDNCDNIRNSTVDGAFAAYYDQVAPWLGSGGPCTDVDGDTYCVPEDCDDGDPDVNPGEVEICDDDIDNNCDGTIDEGCGSCTDVDGDGSCVEDDCDDNDPFNFPGNTENCTDGQDNNCDGLADVFDPTCNGCLPKGDPCTTGAECCSGLCHPRKYTCK